MLASLPPCPRRLMAWASYPLSANQDRKNSSQHQAPAKAPCTNRSGGLRAGVDARREITSSLPISIWLTEFLTQVHALKGALTYIREGDPSRANNAGAARHLRNPEYRLDFVSYLLINRRSLTSTILNLLPGPVILRSLEADSFRYVVPYRAWQTVARNVADP